MYFGYLFALTCFAIATFSIWRPVGAAAGRRLHVAIRIVSPLALLGCCVIWPLGVPVLLLVPWLLPPGRPSRPVRPSDRVAWTIFAAGIYLMVAVAAYAMASEEDHWRPHETIRLHVRVFFGCSILAAAGPLAACAMDLRRRCRGAAEGGPVPPVAPIVKDD